MWRREAEEDREGREGERDGILIASATLIQHSRDLVLQARTASFLPSPPRRSRTPCLHTEPGGDVASTRPLSGGWRPERFGEPVITLPLIFLKKISF